MSAVALHLSTVPVLAVDTKMCSPLLRCVSCLLLAVLAVLLTDVCAEEQGKICSLSKNVVLQLSSLEHHASITREFVSRSLSACL